MNRLKVLIVLFLLQFVTIAKTSNIELDIVGEHPKFIQISSFNNGVLETLLEKDQIRMNKVNITAQFYGLYVLQVDQSSFTFLVHNDKVNLRLNKGKNNWILEAPEDDENECWLQFISERENYLSKMTLLHPLILNYDKQSELYIEIVKEFDRVQDVYNQFINDVPSHFLAKSYILSIRKPDLLASKRYEDQTDYLKKRWFYGFVWHENSLLNSDIINNKIDEYLNLFYEKGLSKTQQELAFKEGIDNILTLSKQNQSIHEYVLSYIVNKLEKFGLEKLISHIALTHVTDSGGCGLENQNAVEIIQRLKRYGKVSVGNIAPDFSIKNVTTKNTINLSHLKEKNLIVFWSSKCIHCQYMIPKLEIWFKNNPSWNLISISLDTDPTTLKSFVKEKQIKHPIYSDFLGWQSPLVKNYNVNSTPYFYVLDKNGVIIDKPISLDELN